EVLMVPGTGLEPVWSCPRGIFLPTTACAAAGPTCLPDRHLESGLSLHHAARGGVGGGRQGSTLSCGRQPLVAKALRIRLSAGLQAPPPVAGRWDWFPEFDPIHAGGFPWTGCSIFFKSLASTNFATRA